jgi:type I restriction enzyme S subunit
MTMNDEYKDTPLGSLPENWEVVRLEDVLTEVDIRVIDFEENDASKFDVLSLTKNDGLILQSERFDKRIATEDVSLYKVVQYGQLVYNPYVIWEGAIHILRKFEYGLVSPAYPIWRAMDGIANPFYLDDLLRTPLAIAAYNRFAAGAVNRRRTISKKDFRQIEIPLPPVPEQCAIAYVLSTVRHNPLKQQSGLSPPPASSSVP